MDGELHFVVHKGDTKVFEYFHFDPFDVRINGAQIDETLLLAAWSCHFKLLVPTFHCEIYNKYVAAWQMR